MDRESLRKTLLNLVEQETWERPENLFDSVNLRDGLKLDSVDMLSISLRAEELLGITIDSSDFATVQTVGDLLDTLQSKVAAKNQPKAA
jgi:acyl carrier protein